MLCVSLDIFTVNDRLNNGCHALRAALILTKIQYQDVFFLDTGFFYKYYYAVFYI